MNQKFRLCWLVLLSSFTLSLSAQTNQPDGGDSPKNGRYQLIAATLLDTGSGQSVQTVMKIDTQTGQVWRLVKHSMELEGGTRFPIDGWEEVNDSFTTAAERYNKAVETKIIHPKLK